MSVKDKAREAQNAAFDANDNPEMRRITNDLYDAVDSMDRNQKTLLIRQALGSASAAVHQVATHPEHAGGIAMMLNGLVAIAGYANETLREDDGATATGDTSVDKVLGLFKELVSVSAREGMTDEQRNIADRVKARVESGEDFERVIEEETRNFTAASGNPAPSTTKGDESNGSYGLYL